MGLLSFLFRPKLGSKSEDAIRQLQKWELAHFPEVKKLESKQRTQPIDRSFYAVYLTEAGEQIPLSRMSVPQPPRPQPQGFLEKLLNWIEPEPAKMMLPEVFMQFRNGILHEIQQFRANILKLEHLSNEVKSDSFFEEIDRLFSKQLETLFHELLFCKVTQLVSYDYYSALYIRISRCVSVLGELNRNTEEYMYTLASSEHENVGQALETIRIRVQAMNDAMKTVREI
ncbi:MAG: hypothetical protein J6S92_01890 [Oscillospiraceae bacterium]|nr:hypothetical protein [Oscillospiraceae bacterium]